MSHFHALEYCGPDDNLIQRRITVNDIRERISDSDGASMLSFFVVDELLANVIEDSDGFIVDRGTKHPSKALSACFPKRSGSYAIKAEYSKAGRALQGVAALIKSFKKTQRTIIFLIGVPYEVYLSLKDNSKPPEAFSSDEGIEDAYIRRQNILLGGDPEITVDKSVSKAYIGKSSVAEIVRKQIVLASRSDFRVLIQGDSGTGKEVVARLIHEKSPRNDTGIFVVVNCGGIAEYLFLSELFGHKKGAFTGALTDKTGLWTIADKGTLFLDEIGDLPYHLQMKVLRALEEKKYYPVGATEEVKSDPRIVCATNKNLKQMVEDGRFREDLYYRINSLLIRTLPLRKHREDISCMASLFWDNYKGDSGIELSEEVLNEFQRWAWPGNARDVRSYLERLWSIIRGRPVTLEIAKAVLEDYFGTVSCC